MRIMIDPNQCTGCGNCIKFCPQKILRISADLNVRDIYPIEMINEEKCLSCGNCELMCTAGAVHLEKAQPDGFELIDKKAIPPHAGCYLGSLSKALADCLVKMNVQNDTVIFKKKTADVNLKVETHDYSDDQFYEDGLAYKRMHPDKLVILICSSSKEYSTMKNKERFLSLSGISVTLINTLNWFETEDFKVISKGGSHVLEELSLKQEPSFCARGGVRSPKEMRQLTDFLMRALESQIQKKGFSFVEVVFPCFYRLAGRPQTMMPYQEIDKINQWFDQVVKPDYKEGIYKE